MIKMLTLCLLIFPLATTSAGAAPETALPTKSQDNTRYAIRGWGEPVETRDGIPMVLEEFMLDTSIYWFGAPEWQWSPAIAFDGTNYLVVWHDDRNGLDYGIYGTRLTQSGAVLDSRGITISDIARDQSYPSVAFNGVHYLVVWQDYRNGTDYDIYGSRVHPSGAVLDPSGLPISTSPTRERYPRLAFDGNNYLVVWEEGIDFRNFDIRATRVDPFGNVLDPLGITVCDDTLWQRFPSVAFGLGSYLIAWDNGIRKNADIHAARVDLSGNLRDSTAIVVCSTSYLERSPAVGFDGRDYLVVWEHWRDEIDIFGTRIDTSGAVIDPSPTTICTLAGRNRHPVLAFGDSTYLIAWERRDIDDSWVERWHSVCGAVLDTSGRVTPWWMDSVAIVDAPKWQRSPAVAFDGTNHFVVWGDHRNVDGDIYGSRVKNWYVLDPEGLCLSSGPDKKWYPSAAFAGISYLVAWQNTGKDGYDIRAARVSQTGSILDPSAIVVSNATRSQISPRVASDGMDYFVVWAHKTDMEEGADAQWIYGSRVTADGVVRDTSGIPISTTTEWEWNIDPAVASNGERYLVAWVDLWGTGLRGAMIDNTGTVDTLPGSIYSGAASLPVVASDGENWLVTWSYYIYINGARVDAEGTVLDPVSFSVCSTQVPSECAHHWSAFGGGTYFVVWEDIRNGSEYDIYGARVDTSGTLLDTSGIAITTAPGYQSAPSVVFDGDNFLVVWEDWRSGKSDLWGARVDTSGVVIDTGGVKLIDKPSSRMAPNLAKGADDNLLLVYDGVADHPYDAYRVFGALYTDVRAEEGPAHRFAAPKFELKQGVPNPFNTSTTVRYAVANREDVLLRVYDSSGRLARELEAGDRPAGSHAVVWDGRDASGRNLPSGIYFFRLQAGSATATTKTILMR